MKNNKKEIENKKLKTKRIILSTLLFLLTLTIFTFSNEPGYKSESTSDKFTSNIIDKVTEITNKDITDSKKKDIIINTRFIVRKIAHFSVYFVLGILIYLLLKTYNINNIVILSIMICFVFGCLDEFHQIFIPGRTARFYDCLIDTLGSSASIGIIHITINYLNKRKDKK